MTPSPNGRNLGVRSFHTCPSCGHLTLVPRERGVWRFVCEGCGAELEVNLDGWPGKQP